ncbi:hypothetical protein MMC22_006943 [Lobaria immixta]|nr:hypothetical protein [Lobaria immixta]
MQPSLSNEVRESLEFEKSNLAQGSVLNNTFYDAPHEVAETPPGTLLRVEKDVNTAEYLLPPTTALSRFVYQSETLNGSKVPVSAFMLWPYSPRSQPDGYPVVAWAHGTSGFDANAAPSNHKNLWQHFLAPYQLALQGYVVVGTDYAGLGIKKYASGETIIHEYLASPSQAKDVIYSVRAAQTAFPELSKRFVAIGHSQGGGAVWAIAQIAATRSISGYLGGVAISPYANLIEDKAEFPKIIAANMVPALASIFPDFQPRDMLTPEGEHRVKLVHETDAGTSSAVALLSGVEILKPNWKENVHFRRYQEMTSNGGKAIKGPLLIAHGKADPVLSETVVGDAVQKTADMDPSAAIVYYRLANVTHVCALPASQHLWTDWIADRFAGREMEPTCHQYELDCARSVTAHQSDQNWYLEPASKPYQAPGP